MTNVSRRNLFALASGLLVPYEPERVYSFVSVGWAIGDAAKELIIVQHGVRIVHGFHLEFVPQRGLMASGLTARCPRWSTLDGSVHYSNCIPIRSTGFDWATDPSAAPRCLAEWAEAVA